MKLMVKPIRKRGFDTFMYPIIEGKFCAKHTEPEELIILLIGYQCKHCGYMFKCDEPCRICPECGYWYYGQESIPVLVQRRDESFMNDPRIRVRPNVDRDPLIVEQQRIRKKKSMLDSFVDGLSGH